MRLLSKFYHVQFQIFGLRLRASARQHVCAISFVCYLSSIPSPRTIVEEKILEFAQNDRPSGQGKPLKFLEELDGEIVEYQAETEREKGIQRIRNIGKFRGKIDDFIMYRRGYVPKWIQMQRMIMNDLNNARLLMKKAYFECFVRDVIDPPQPPQLEQRVFRWKAMQRVYDTCFNWLQRKEQKKLEREWQKQLDLLKKEREQLWKEVVETVEMIYRKVNQQIPEYNVIVPSMKQQLPQFSFQRELKIVKEYFESGEFDVELYKEGNLREVTTILLTVVDDEKGHD